ncbi:G coupled receptor like-protein [Echria macrotheca]|uniref:G coupled receptor like-protein n=1 Tax=Echria macrotheca TaxID=438768 RepID=A0AAJ0BIP9_9PEZI|nr:G coupled receptor like-protein [Echria macrotheca]
MATLTEEQIQVLVVLERVGGSLSLISVLLILCCYSLFPRLRTVPNTFIVFASIANAGAAIGCIIAYDGIRAGLTSPLCQLQGFLLEMFIQSDPWWSLAMALNVLLVFVHGANPRAIRKWWWLYCLICYGGPFALALGCLLLKTPTRPAVYGDAGTWCWISNEWNSLRIYTSFMFVWVCITTSLVIYVGVGIHLFRVKHKFQRISSSGSRERGTPEIRVLHDYVKDRKSVVSISDWPITPSSDPRLFNDAFAELLSGSPSHNRQESPLPSPFLQSSVTKPNRAHSPHRSPNPSFDSSYSRYTATSAGLTPFLISTTPSSPPPPPQTRQGTSTLDRLGINDPIKRAYLRTALLFALSVLVTWIPTTIHRTHELIHGEPSPFAYDIATAAVLPLQGVWNGIIFAIASWTTLRECVADLFTVPRTRQEGHVATRRRSTLAGRQQGRTVYSMWQDAEPVSEGTGNGNGSAVVVGLGISGVFGGSRSRAGSAASNNRPDSWDFVDIGVDEGRMAAFRESAQTVASGSGSRSVESREGTPGQKGNRKEESYRMQQAKSASREMKKGGRRKEPPRIVVVDCPGGMI